VILCDGIDRNVLCRWSALRKYSSSATTSCAEEPISFKPRYLILRRQSSITHQHHHRLFSPTKRISTSKLSASLASPTTQPNTTTSPIMPRQSRGAASAPKRPSVPTPQSRSAPQQPAQARQASTYAQPPANQHAPPPAAPQQAAPAASGGSGLFGQMASTAA
jgi:hypothetical protein